VTGPERRTDLVKKFGKNDERRSEKSEIDVGNVE